MNCTICGKPIVLVPSAAERSRKYGEPASYYTSLFPQHAACALKERAEGTTALMKTLKEK